MAARSTASLVLSSPRREHCLHCGADLRDGRDGATADFCCRGCAEVHALLLGQGLGRFYELGGGVGHAVVRSAVDRHWVEPLQARILSVEVPQRLNLDVQGLHCSACVWLLETLFRRREGALGIVVNPTLGSVELIVDRRFSLARYVEDVEAIGYRFGPPSKERPAGGSDLLWRLGVCVAIAMNTMIFGLAVYCGLPEGPVQDLFHALDFGLSFVAVLVGGSVFFRSARAAIAQRVLHLDVPIALGIALVFVSSTVTYVTRRGASSYFDTLNVFIALMLVGRFLQERVLQKNRAMLLASSGAEGLLTRRIGASGIELVSVVALEGGDRLLVGPEDLVPVDARLILGPSSATADFSLDWISGESAPRSFRDGEVVPAGAFLRGERAVVLVTTAAFALSNVGALLRPRTRRDDDQARATDWHRALTRTYVLAVLALAALASVGWAMATHDAVRTMDVVASLLIVTCPCAFGIATPLAYEFAQASLRRRGLFVRTPGFLDRAAEIREVVFDKTGTLTTGRLSVARPACIDGLTEELRARLHALAARSTHPKSCAIVALLEERGGTAFDVASDVREIAGRGLELVTETHRYRLGSLGWATEGRVGELPFGADVAFTEDGAVLCTFVFGEELRADAPDEIAALNADGYRTFILSGDAEDAARRMADRCGIPRERAFGGHDPEQKAAWLRAREDKGLFVGDGINDSFAAEAAHCAGTPAIDRPFMAARSDFYFVTPGIRPIREALATARRLARVVRWNLLIAVFYNVITVGLALAGRMTPLACAVLMPVSSVSTVLFTIAAMRDQRSTWKS